MNGMAPSRGLPFPNEGWRAQLRPAHASVAEGACQLPRHIKRYALIAIPEGDDMDQLRMVARLAALPEGRGVRVDVQGRKILLVRQGDGVHAYAAECPHANGPLEEGAVCNGRIVCPWHKGTFRLSDGSLLEPPALDGLARYRVRVTAGGDVLVAPEPIHQPAPATPEDARTMLIVGAGAAGTAAAAALREAGFGGRVLLVGQEPGDPFDRTSLSKFVMAGAMPPDEAPPLLPPDFFTEQRIDRIAAEVERLNVAACTVRTRDGQEFAYDAALVATGGVPKRLDIPGADLGGVQVLRTRQDAAAILACVRDGGRVVILGSSFIGLEVASGLRERKLDVAVVAPEAVPFARQFGPRLGSMFRALHEANGVVFHLGTQAERLEGQGRVARVVLADGTVLPADLVIMGVGVAPATGFVDGLKLAEDGGIPVDGGMLAADGLYAAGDIALFPLPRGGERVRVEHWRVAQQHARIAAHNMLGGAEVYSGVPFFWTYHYGKSFEYLGHASHWDDVVIDGDPDQHRFVAFLVRGGNVAAVVACQRERETAILAESLRRSLAVDTALQLIRGA